MSKSSWPLQHDLHQIEHTECQHTGPIQEHPVSIWEVYDVEQGSELQVEPLLCTGISTKGIACIISVTLLNKLVQLSPSYNGKTKIFAQYPIAVLLVFEWTEILTQAFKKYYLFLLEYRCFTMLCLCCSRKWVSYLYTYIPSLLEFLPTTIHHPTPLGQHRTLSWTLCAK